MPRKIVNGWAFATARPDRVQIKVPGGEQMVVRVANNGRRWQGEFVEAIIDAGSALEGKPVTFSNCREQKRRPRLVYPPRPSR